MKYHPGPKVFTLSIMHTGTSFLNILIRKWLIGHVHFHMPFSFEDNKLKEIADIRVVPMRHPRDVWTSWWLRGQSEREFRLGYHMMNDFVKHYDVMFFPIDVPDRADYLNALAKRMGVQLTTDWAPQGVFQGERRPMPRDEEIDLTTIMELPVVRRFYS